VIPVWQLFQCLSYVLIADIRAVVAMQYSMKMLVLLMILKQIIFPWTISGEFCKFDNPGISLFLSAKCFFFIKLFMSQCATIEIFKINSLMLFRKH